jgi:hypothetical protein
MRSASRCRPCSSRPGGAPLCGGGATPPSASLFVIHARRRSFVDLATVRSVDHRRLPDNLASCGSASWNALSRTLTRSSTGSPPRRPAHSESDHATGIITKLEAARPLPGMEGGAGSCRKSVRTRRSHVRAHRPVARRRVARAPGTALSADRPRIPAPERRPGLLRGQGAPRAGSRIDRRQSPSATGRGPAVTRTSSSSASSRTV